MNSYYKYRELTKKEELIQYFKCRFQVFSTGKLAAFLKPGEVEMDIDAYDLRAKHYGVFKVEGKEETLVGGHRMIKDEISQVMPIIKEIVKEYFTSTQAIDKTPLHPFYMVSISSQQEIMTCYLEAMKNKGLEVVESSRFFLLPTEKSLNLLKSFAYAANACSIYIGQNNVAITSCTTKMSNFWKMFGLRLFPNTQTEFINALEACNLIQAKDQIPSRIKAELKKMEEAYLMTEEICFTPNLARSYFAPDFTVPFYSRQLHKAA